MENALIEAAKQVPAMVVLFLIVFIFLDREEKREAKRDAAAKDLEQMRQKFESENNAMWAQHVKGIVETLERVSDVLTEALKEHEKASEERYKRLGITKDLLDAAKDREREQRSRRGT